MEKVLRIQVHELFVSPSPSALLSVQGEWLLVGANGRPKVGNLIESFRPEKDLPTGSFQEREKGD